MKQNNEYHPYSKLFHWLVVALLMLQFAVAWIMPNIRGNKGPELLVSIHMSFGLVILLIMALRLLWRTTHTVPPLPEGMKWWQRVASHMTHQLLYLLFIILPFTGWLWASAKGWQITLLGGMKFASPCRGKYLFRKINRHCTQTFGNCRSTSHWVSYCRGPLSSPCLKRWNYGAHDAETFESWKRKLISRRLCW